MLSFAQRLSATHPVIEGLEELLPIYPQLQSVYRTQQVKRVVLCRGNILSYKNALTIAS
jgi:hypothetical protein